MAIFLGKPGGEPEPIANEKCVKILLINE